MSAPHQWLIELTHPEFNYPHGRVSMRPVDAESPRRAGRTKRTGYPELRPILGRQVEAAAFARTMLAVAAVGICGRASAHKCGSLRAPELPAVRGWGKVPAGRIPEPALHRADLRRACATGQQVVVRKHESNQ